LLSNHQTIAPSIESNAAKLVTLLYLSNKYFPASETNSAKLCESTSQLSGLILFRREQSRMEFSHHYTGIGAAETETVAKRDADVMGAGLVELEKACDRCIAGSRVGDGRAHVTRHRQRGYECLHGTCATALLQEPAGITHRKNGMASTQ
jgi:hypothetical protein